MWVRRRPNPLQLSHCLLLAVWGGDDDRFSVLIWLISQLIWKNSTDLNSAWNSLSLMCYPTCVIVDIKNVERRWSRCARRNCLKNRCWWLVFSIDLAHFSIDFKKLNGFEFSVKFSISDVVTDVYYLDIKNAERRWSCSACRNWLRKGALINSNFLIN